MIRSVGGAPWTLLALRRSQGSSSAEIPWRGHGTHLVAAAVGLSPVTVAGRAAMKKSEMAERVADRMGLSKSAAEGAVDAVFETIVEALAREEAVRIAGFGTFATRSGARAPDGTRRPGRASRSRPRKRRRSRRARRSGRRSTKVGRRRPAGRTGDRDARPGSTRRTV